MKNKFYAFWLCLACVLVFFIQFFPGVTEMFILNNSSYVEPWRFVSSIFLHGSPAHLLYNLFALALFGFILESIIGSKRFLIVFFASGIFANLISVNFYSASLGASGAIYGTIGCLAFLRPKMAVFVYGLPMPMFLAAAVWIIGGVVGIFIPSNTGHIAHLSGIAAGFLFGFFYRNFREKREKRSRIMIDESLMRQWEDGFMRQR